MGITSPNPSIHPRTLKQRTTRAAFDAQKAKTKQIAFTCLHSDVYVFNSICGIHLVNLFVNTCVSSS